MATILVVDDTAGNRDVLTCLLKHRGHRMLEASDGVDALITARAERPDLVIADILMPTMDGFELVRRLRLEPEIAATPVVFYTANYHRDEARALAESCGVRHLLTKPEQPEVILDTVARALRGDTAAPPPLEEEAFEREHLRLLTDQLARKAGELESANEKLQALVDLGQQLGTELEPLRLLEQYCNAGRNLLGASTAAVGMLAAGGGGLRHLLTSGIDRNSRAGLSAADRSGGALERVASERTPYRAHHLGPDEGTTGLPAGYPPATSFMAVPVASPSRVFGWLAFTDRIGADRFSDADERLAMSLAAELGIACENAERFLALEHRAVELENAVKELEAFSYSVSHDLRAPLRAIHGFAAALKEDCGAALGEEGGRYLEIMSKSARNMGRLIDDLLAFSRLGRQSLASETFDLGELARSVFAELAAAEPERRIELKVKPMPAAYGDPSMVRQVLQNLLGNAVKFTGGRERALITLSGTHSEREVVYTVTDNGAGFDMKYVDKLFGVFQRLHAPDEFEGTGIGLSIVRRIVHRHGGRTWAIGEPGKGAGFYFALPCEESYAA